MMLNYGWFGLESLITLTTFAITWLLGSYRKKLLNHKSHQLSSFQLIYIQASRLLQSLAWISWLYISISISPWQYFFDTDQAKAYELFTEYKNMALQSLWLLTLTWVFLTIIKKVEQSIDQSGEQSLLLSKQWHSTARVLFMFLRGIIYITLTLTLLRIFDLKGLADNILATGAFSTILIGLAAKDALSNIFGGFMVLFDKPFSVGDYILSADKDIEGIVEKIGWRITQVRTPLRRLKFIPNNIFTNITIENLSLMSHRRIRFSFGIRYKDHDKIQPICHALETDLLQLKIIAKRESNFITFEKMADSSLNIFVNLFTKPMSFVDYNKNIEMVLLKVIDTVHQHGADFPFPTRTIDGSEAIEGLKKQWLEQASI